MISAIIFDLDNCLAPATAVGEDLYQPAFAAVRGANRGRLTEDVLERALGEIWRHPLDWVADQYDFSQEMRDAAWKYFLEMEVKQPMKGYDDVDVLTDIGADCYLVTSGFRRLQESKIKALNLRPYFKGVFVDAIEEPQRLGKLGHFERILIQGHLTPERVLVVGDNPDSELAAGKQIGATTVQSLRPGVPRADAVDHHISALHELCPIIDGTQPSMKRNG